MTRKLKALGLVLAAVFMMSAVAASAAQAEEGKFTGFSTEGETRVHEHTIFDGTSEANLPDIFTATAAVKCHGHFTGTSLLGTGQTTSPGTPAGADSELTVNPEYSYPETNEMAKTGEPTCTTGGIWTTHVDMNGCHYKFHAGETVEPNKFKGTADLVCGTEGKNGPVTINITKAAPNEGETKCTIKVPAQNGLGPVYYYNKKAEKPTDVTVESAAEKVKYTSEGGLLNCGVANGEHTNATYEGHVTVKGFNTEGKQIDVEVSD